MLQLKNPQLEKRLEALGLKDEEAKEQWLQRAIEDALAACEEDAHWARVAVQRKASSVQERTWTLEEIERGDDLAS